ncbi:MAG: hypothetical protein OEM02_12325 [Desulfobulbaceae bacterium]|nr:hypothetical protein [Desulfobulbaceae bacterium]
MKLNKLLFNENRSHINDELFDKIANHIITFDKITIATQEAYLCLLSTLVMNIIHDASNIIIDTPYSITSKICIKAKNTKPSSILQMASSPIFRTLNNIKPGANYDKENQTEPRK